MKKDERLKSLETSLTWLKNESNRLMDIIEKLTTENKNLYSQLKESKDEAKAWRN